MDTLSTLFTRINSSPPKSGATRQSKYLGQQVRSEFAARRAFIVPATGENSRQRSFMRNNFMATRHTSGRMITFPWGGLGGRTNCPSSPSHEPAHAQVTDSHTIITVTHLTADTQDCQNFAMANQQSSFPTRFLRINTQTRKQSLQAHRLFFLGPQQKPQTESLQSNIISLKTFLLRNICSQTFVSHVCNHSPTSLWLSQTLTLSNGKRLA